MRKIGRYELIDELGRGAMGVVYRAKDPTIGRTVAVKSIRLSEFADPKELAQLRDRLMREAQSAGILSHPGIVTVFDVAEDEDNAYIFMEYIDGDTLENLLLADKPPDRETLIRIFRETAAALDYAHKKGIIHRDIKPANLMITSEGDVKIADFGVAKIISQQMTVPGMVLGTPFYMSPEQVQGGAIDGRSDQFALGVMAYEILTGKRPYAAETLATLILKIVTEKPPLPESLNPKLDASVNPVFEKVLAKAPEGRYPSCAEFVEELARTVESSREWEPLHQGATGGPTTLETAETVAEVVAPAAAPVAATDPDATAMLPPPPKPPTAPEPPAPEPPPLPEPPPASETETEKPAAKPVLTEAAAPPPAPVETAESTPGPGSRTKTYVLAAVAAVVIAIALVAWMQFGGDSGADIARTPVVVERPEAPVPSDPPPAEQAADGERQDAAGAVPVEEETLEQTPAPVAVTPPPVEPEPPKPAPAPVVREREVIFDSDPQGATVVLDDDPEVICVTPCPVTLAYGRHTMSIRRDGYRDALKIFETPKTVEVKVVLEQMAGSLALQSKPPGATVKVNGEVRPEKTPSLISLPAGKYELVLSLEGFPDYKDTLEIKDRVVANLNVDWQ